MTDLHPFQLKPLPSALRTPTRELGILADVGELEEYYVLFEKYGFGGTSHSWTEHIETIIEEFEPELLDHLEFVAHPHTFFAYADSEATAAKFLQLLTPIFGNLGSLQKYLSQADPEDFFA